MSDVATVRQFNRAVTHHMGVLEDHFLGRNRSLGASRVLFEIGEAGTSGIAIRNLRARLSLDSGYISRVLKSLQAEGLIRLSQASDDARVRIVKVTSKGRRELATLNQRSDEIAATTLRGLNDKQRASLVDAMNTVVRLLRASSVSVEIEAPTTHTAQACLVQYFHELAERFEGGFNLEASISATNEELSPPKGYFVIARMHGEVVGCGALKCHSNFGEVKRMWVAASARGLGISKKILLHLESIARQRQLPVLRLETNKVLKEAQALYRSSGYQEVAPFNREPFAHRWFEKRIS